MKKSSKKQQGGAGTESRPEKVVGLDLGDRFSHYCMLTGTGEVMEEGRIQTNAAALEKHFATEPRMRIALEAGTHSGWVSRLLKSCGHQVIVANPRKIPTLTASKSKNDRNDAKQLARMAAFDPELPVYPGALCSPNIWIQSNPLHELVELRRTQRNLLRKGDCRQAQNHPDY